jgi:hypothetical protein
MEAHLMALVDRNLSTHITTAGFRGKCVRTRYTAYGSLRTFLNEVLPNWTQHSPHTGEHALDMLNTATEVHTVLQAYCVEIRDVPIATTLFAQSPIVVEMSRELWSSNYDNVQLEQLKKLKAFIDLLISECPNFYQLYNLKKSEYNQGLQ